MELNLNPEEIQKINNLWRTSRFQRSWIAIQNIINCKDSVTNYFVRNIILIFISIIVGIGFFFLEEQGILPDSVLIDKLMKFIARLILFLIALQILSVLVYSFIGPCWEEKQRSKLRVLYESEILEPILQALYPLAKIDTEHDISPSNIEEVVPATKYYIQSGILKLNNEKDIEIVDLYAYTVSKGLVTGLVTGKDEIKHLHEITGFIGQVYSIKNTHSLKGNLRIIPTKHFLNIKTQGGYLGNMSGGKKINVDDIWQNNHYNIYCTDEQSARMFLTPAVIDLFNDSTSDCGLSLYSNESRIYIATYNNKRLFAAPRNKDSLRSWSIEKAARNIKYAITFAEKIAEIM